MIFYTWIIECNLIVKYFCFIFQEEEQSRLEAEMQKRRDRIERWRAERKRKELESAKKEVQKGSIVTNIQVPTSKKWSLEDDSGDEGRKVLWCLRPN